MEFPDFKRPDDDTIAAVLARRAAMPDYPLTVEDIGRHRDLLIALVREKIRTLAGFYDDTPMTIAEALNHVMMSPQWMRRDEPMA